MADDFTERYGDMLTGSYDCVDRIVLNAYYPLGHSPGGFRTWWRRWHGDSDAELDDAHLMRLAGRFARRVRAWADANGVPVIDCKAGQRKHRIAEEYLASHSVGPGVFLVLVVRARATVWKVRRSPGGVIMNLEKKSEYVNHSKPSSARPSTCCPAPAGWPASCAVGSSAPASAAPACRWTSGTARPSRHAVILRDKHC